jgi:hypothetical protein
MHALDFAANGLASTVAYDSGRMMVALIQLSSVEISTGYGLVKTPQPVPRACRDTWGIHSKLQAIEDVCEVVRLPAVPEH